MYQTRVIGNLKKFKLNDHNIILLIFLVKGFISIQCKIYFTSAPKVYFSMTVEALESDLFPSWEFP